MPAARNSRGVSTGSRPERSSPRSSYDIWFYMAEAVSPARPPDDLVKSLVAADAERQSKWSPKHAMKRPQSTRIRCIPCLKERKEWKTWLNRIGAISKELREHLEDEHAIKFDGGPAKRVTKPPSASSSSSLSPPPQEKPNTISSLPKKTLLEQLATKPAAPHQDRLKVSLGPRKSWPHFQHPAVPQSPAVRLATQAAQVASNPRPRAPKTIENLRTQLDQVKAERDQIKIERDREMDMRRALEAEVQRLKDAARAREEELLKVSRLMCASLQALTGEAKAGSA